MIRVASLVLFVGCVFGTRFAPGDEVVRQRQVVQVQAAGAQAVIQGGNPYLNPAVREQVDPLDPVERVALFTPRGPLVVELSLYLDGKPFRIRREALIDELLAAADKNRDGTPHWTEAIQSQHFSFGRLRAQNEQQLAHMVRMYDQNKNGLVDRAEVRYFLAVMFQGGDFIIIIQSGGGPNPLGVSLLALLDVDKSGELSLEELAQAPRRLKSQDTNDDDVFTLAELSAAASTRIAARPQPRLPVGDANLALLGPLAKADVLFAALKQRYGERDALGPDNFRLAPNLFQLLDANGDGTVEEDEILRLNSVPPHVQLVVRLGKLEEKQVRLAVTLADAVREAVAVNAQGDERVLIDAGGARYQVSVSPGRQMTYNYETTAMQLLARYDADKNNYLEAKEMEGNLRFQFEMWDLDANGKVYAEEIVATYERQLLPLKSQVCLAAAPDGDVLFLALDANGDGRLGLREMTQAAARLAALDKNGDGKLAAAELPRTLRLDFGTGTDGMYAGARVFSDGSGVPAGESPRSRGPDWFVRMDRNADGDLTPREFLGTREQFAKLDRDGDGFIDAAEAQAASP